MHLVNVTRLEHQQAQYKIRKRNYIGTIWIHAKVTKPKNFGEFIVSNVSPMIRMIEVQIVGAITQLSKQCPNIQEKNR